jgi:DNA-binding NarL/FixJ family response regulator
MVIRAIVVEDDDFTRLMISTALQSQGINIIGQVADAPSALALANELKPEVALLDLHLGSGPTGLDLAVELRRILPKIGIVILTSFEDPRLLNPNLPDPPRGSIYLNKKSVNDTQVLVTALTSSTDSSTWNSPNSSKIGLPGAIGDLTDVQLETLRLMAQGLSNAEIAKRRFVTEKSVETAIARLAKIMGVESDPSRNQRVHMAKVYFRALGIDPGGEH